MKKNIALICISFFVMKTHAQVTTTCATGTIKLKTQNYQYGTLDWEKSYNNVDWEKIYNQHDTIYTFTTSKAAYYRAVNKFPSCDPIISAVTLVQRPPIANAGIDRLVNDTYFYLSANTTVSSTGIWTIVQGTGGVIAEPTNPKSKFTGTAGMYKLQWKLTNTCGSSTDQVDVEFTNNQYHNKIVIVDNTDIIQSTPAQIAAGNYIIQFSNPVPVIDNQTILVGQVGNGFLRKVNSVSQNGNTFTISTVQGKLKDLFVDGGFEMGSVFKIDTLLVSNRMSSSNYRRLSKIPTRAEILSTPELQTGKHYFVVQDSIINNSNNNVSMNRTASPNADPDNPVFKFGFDHSLFEQGGLKIKLNGNLTFTPNIYADFKKNLVRTTFKFGLNNATVVNDYTFSITNTTSTPISDHNFSLYSYSKLVYFLVGPVPILINAKVDFNGKITANVDSNINFTHNFQNTVTTNAGITYNNGTWSQHYDDDIKTTVSNNLTISGSLSQSLEIGPKISFLFYDVAGPYIDAKLTEDLNICASTVNLGALAWKAKLDIGGKVTAGVEAVLFDQTIFDHSETWENREMFTVDFPNTISYVSGNQQHYNYFEQLPFPVKVRVMSNKGFAVPGAVVKFAPFQSNGTVGTQYAITDLNGYATTTWIPQDHVRCKLSATVLDCDQKSIDNSPIIFEATEITGLNCTQSTLRASYWRVGNTLQPQGHMGYPPYSYSVDNNVTFTNTAPFVTMTTGGDYTMTVRDQTGCLAFVNFYNGPVTCATSGLGINLQTFGNNIQASASDGRAPYLFSLNNTNNFAATSLFAGLAVGVHRVFVKDINGCTKSSTITITNSNTAIVAYFSISATDYAANNPITFNNLSNNATSYLWNFGDSTTSTQTSPTKFYAAAGNYTVTLTAYNGVAQHTYTYVLTITAGTTNNIMGITTVAVPAGTFMMGSPATEPNRGSDEVLHQVTLSAFQMSKYEITCAQYAAFLNAKGVGSNAIWSTGPYPTQALIAANATYGLTFTNNQWTPATGKANAPMTYVNWFGAASYAQYAGGRLPTESEWEYAARGGTTTAFSTGACLSNTQANYNWAYPQTGCTNTSSAYPNTTQTVGTYPANAFGLHDMHGNVWEWCADWYGTYPTAVSTNPTGPSTGSGRVLRGGGWYRDARHCRSAGRSGYAPTYTYDFSGFRVVF